MKTIEVTVKLGLVGCVRKDTIEVDDDATEDEIEESARDALFELIDWHWEPVEARPKVKRPR